MRAGDFDDGDKYKRHRRRRLFSYLYFYMPLLTFFIGTLYTTQCVPEVQRHHSGGIGRRHYMLYHKNLQKKKKNQTI